MSRIFLKMAENMVLGVKGKPTSKPPFPWGKPGGRYWIRTSDTRLVRPVLFR